MAIKVEKNEEIITIIIDNPDVKNAIDGQSALELYQAFLAFENDERSKVAVLWGKRF